MAKSTIKNDNDGSEPNSSTGIDGSNTTEPNLIDAITNEQSSGTEQPSISFTISDGESAIPSGKRGRGRPRKNPETQGAQTVIKSKAQKVTAQDKKDAKELAEFIISSFEMMSALILAQQNTSFNEMEKFLLEPALRRQLERMNFSAIEKANKFLDPLFIFGALALWANRVIIQTNKEKNSRANDTTKQSEQSTFFTSDNKQTKPDDKNAFDFPNFGEAFASTIGISSS